MKGWFWFVISKSLVAGVDGTTLHRFVCCWDIGVILSGVAIFPLVQLGRW